MRSGLTLVVLACLALCGCARSHELVCADGHVCPQDTTCVALDTTDGPATLCATDAQLAPCIGAADLTDCGDNMLCHGGACLPAGCGNALLEPGEVCDDHNNRSGDGCSAECTSNETCGNGKVDPIKEEQCDDGPAGAGLSHDGCSSKCKVETPRWSRLIGPWNSPYLSAVYDTERQRVVALIANSSSCDTWEWDARAWEPRVASTSPPPRDNFAVAYDTRRRRTVLFGGSGFGDTWEWDGNQWTRMQPLVSPVARGYHAMTYDPVGKRIIVFGGTTGSIGNGAALDETWAYDGTTWTQIVSPSAPSPRVNPALAFDPHRGVVVLFGGMTAGSVMLGDTWELRGNTWTQVTFTGSTPEPTRGRAFAFDPGLGALVLVGGARTGSWTFDGTTWTPYATTLFVDRDADLVTTTDGLTLFYQGNAYRWQPTTVPPTWQRIEQGWAPIFDTGQRAATDNARGRTYIVGGDTDSFFLQTYNGNYGRTAMPASRTVDAIAFDIARDEAVIFGGVTGTNNTETADTLTFSPATRTFTTRTPAASPPARYGHALAYDSARKQTVLFGGRTGPYLTSTLYSDTWLWDGINWSPVVTPPGSTPPARDSAALAYDPIRQRTILVGGVLASQEAASDTWDFDGQTWTEHANAGAPIRFDMQAAWDTARGRLVVVGGSTSNSTFFFNDAYEWDGSTWHAVPTGDALPGRSNHVVFSSQRNGGVIVSGGLGAGYVTQQDIWWLHWASDTPDDACDGADRDHDGRIGCDDPDCWWACHPLCPPGTTCDAAAPSCGDGTCSAVETCVTCASDCGACASFCGDGACNSTESLATCPGDCTP